MRLGMIAEAVQSGNKEEVEKIKAWLNQQPKESRRRSKDVEYSSSERAGFGRPTLSGYCGNSICKVDETTDYQPGNE